MIFAAESFGYLASEPRVRSRPSPSSCYVYSLRLLGAQSTPCETEIIPAGQKSSEAAHLEPSGGTRSVRTAPYRFCIRYRTYCFSTANIYDREQGEDGWKLKRGLGWRSASSPDPSPPECGLTEQNLRNSLGHHTTDQRAAPSPFIS